MDVLKTSNQRDLKDYIVTQLKNASHVPIQILSASLSPLRDDLDEFEKLVGQVLTKGCHVTIALANPAHHLFEELSPNPTEAKDRIIRICDLLKKYFEKGLELYLISDAFFNATYQFGEQILLVTYLMREFSASSTSALIMWRQNTLFETYQTQFMKVVSNPKISKRLSAT